MQAVDFSAVPRFYIKWAIQVPLTPWPAHFQWVCCHYPLANENPIHRVPGSEVLYRHAITVPSWSPGVNYSASGGSCSRQSWCILQELLKANPPAPIAILQGKKFAASLWAQVYVCLNLNQILIPLSSPTSNMAFPWAPETLIPALYWLDSFLWLIACPCGFLPESCYLSRFPSVMGLV